MIVCKLGVRGSSLKMTTRNWESTILDIAITALVYDIKSQIIAVEVGNDLIMALHTDRLICDC